MKVLSPAVRSEVDNPNSLKLKAQLNLTAAHTVSRDRRDGRVSS